MAIDANGPLSRLRDAIFNPDIYKGIFEWAKVSAISQSQRLSMVYDLTSGVMKEE